MRQSLGSKRNEMNEDDIRTIVRTFCAFEIVDARELDKPAEQKSNRGRQSAYPKVEAPKIFAGKNKGTLYIGVTSKIVQRILQHNNKFVKGFTENYKVHTLVYYELHAEMESAITREKQMKKWKRDWKIKLIEKENPQWRDLWEEIL